MVQRVKKERKREKEEEGEGERRVQQNFCGWRKRGEKKRRESRKKEEKFRVLLLHTGNKYTKQPPLSLSLYIYINLYVNNAEETQDPWLFRKEFDGTGLYCMY